MHVTKELSASIDYFRLMFVFLCAGSIHLPSETHFVPVPFREFVCYLLAVSMTMDWKTIKELLPWNGSPRNTKRST
jgi:hypothetical protein